MLFIIRVARVALTLPQDQEDDVMNSLTKQRYRDGSPIPDHEIAHILIALLMAGQHTSSATSSWALLHIADRADIGYVSPIFSVHFF